MGVLVLVLKVMALQRWLQSYISQKMPWNLSICSVISQPQNTAQSTSFLESLKEDAFLWNTPKKRKSIYRQYRKRYGMMYGAHTGENGGGRRAWGESPMIKPNKRVMEETKEIGNKISDTFGRFVPHDKEVKIFYKGEKESFKGVEDNKMPVEIEKERPAFFSK